MWELVQVTAQYSNAVLLAVLPHISDFARKLDLPVPTPINAGHIQEFRCDPRKGETGGAVILTNGSVFTFLEGRVCVYRSPSSYYSLQDPELVPQFYGPVKLTETEALRSARVTIKKLGYENTVFNADSAPLITPPERTGQHWIPRYLFPWLDPTWQKPKDPASVVPALLEIEINASNGRVEMWITASRDTRKPSQIVGADAPVLLNTPQKAQLSGGQHTSPVSDDLARTFLNALLPKLSDFIKKAGLETPTPVTTNQVLLAKYACRILDGQPMAQLYLTNGDRFNYQHGYFAAFYAHDAMDKFPDTGKTEDFLGHISLSTNQAISLCEGVLRKLGYRNKLSAPIVSYAPSRGGLTCTRFTYFWKHPGQEFPFASFEVDMETKRVKSIYLNDAAFLSASPKINWEVEREVLPPKETQPSSALRSPEESHTATNRLQNPEMKSQNNY